MEMFEKIVLNNFQKVGRKVVYLVALIAKTSVKVCSQFGPVEFWILNICFDFFPTAHACRKTTANIWYSKLNMSKLMSCQGQRLSNVLGSSSIGCVEFWILNKNCCLLQAGAVEKIQNKYLKFTIRHVQIDELQRT